MRKSLILFVLLLFGAVLRANGDPVAERSALTLARTPVAVHVPEVKLLDEQCHFTLRDGYTEVEVRYLLHNQSAKDFRQLPYGFPVDWLGSGAAHWESRDFYSESIIEYGWRDSYVRDVMFSLDGQSLPWRCSGDTMLRRQVAVYEYEIIKEVMWNRDSTLPESDPLLTPDSTGYFYTAARERQIIDKYGDTLLWYNQALNRRWYYLRLDIPAGKVVELKVRYRIENPCYQSLGTGQRIFRASAYNQGVFRYDFSPAAYWGDGRVQRFSIELGANPWQDYDVKVEGLPMTLGNQCYRYTARDFDLAAAEPLEVTYTNELSVHEELPTLLSHRFSPDRYTVTLSGVDPKYPAGNLCDMDLATAAVLRPDGDGSLYVTIRFHDSVMLYGALVYNGYCKDRQTWLNNSRIDTLDYIVGTRGELSGKPYVDERKIFYPDANWLQELQGNVPKDFTWQGLTDAAIKLPVVDYINPWHPDFRQKVKEITIRITAVKPGKKYNDLCISEIILIGD